MITNVRKFDIAKAFDLVAIPAGLPELHRHDFASRDQLEAYIESWEGGVPCAT